MISGYYVLLTQNKKLYVNTDTTFNHCNGTLYGVSEDNKEFSMNTTLSFPDVIKLSYYLDLERKPNDDGTYPINLDVCETEETRDEGITYNVDTEGLHVRKTYGFYLCDDSTIEYRATPSYIKGLKYQFSLTDIDNRLGESECKERLRNAIQDEINKASKTVSALTKELSYLD